MPDQIDPLADLKAEIAAEAAAAAGTQPEPEPEPEPDPVVEETLAEEAKLAEAEEEQAKIAEAQANAVPPSPRKKKAKAAEERMVPVERLNEYAVKVRQLEKANEELEKKLNPPPPPPPQAPRTEDQIRAEARAQARLEIQLERFQEAGNKDFTQPLFDAACDKIGKLIGGPTNLVAIAIEATGNPENAAKAIYRLGVNDAPEIEAFLRLSQIRQGAELAKLAATRTKRAQAEEEEPRPRRRQQQVEVEEEEEFEPISPIVGANAVNESLGDDVPPEVWFDRFEKQVMNKKLPH